MITTTKIKESCFKSLIGYIAIQDCCVLYAVYGSISSYLLKDVWSQIMFVILDFALSGNFTVHTGQDQETLAVIIILLGL